MRQEQEQMVLANWKAPFCGQINEFQQAIYDCGNNFELN